MQVGFRKGISFDGTRRNWDGTGPRPLAWTIWYPTDTQSLSSVPSDASWFKRAPVVTDGTARRPNVRLPVVLLSHGSGATAIAIEWLGHRLARQGFVAIAVDHHGHTGSEPYRAEGFLCLWERAADLTALLDDRSWRDQLDIEAEERAAVAGFSAGAYTAMLLAGARVAYSQFEPDNPVKSPIRGPREFPNLADELPRLHGNPIFREAWERRRDDFTDSRVNCAVAIAPGRSVLGFSRGSLGAIRTPIRIIGGDSDTVAPARECCTWLHDHIVGSAVEILQGGVGHYTFLTEGSDLGKKAAPELFLDEPGLDRRAIHDHVSEQLSAFFRVHRRAA